MKRTILLSIMILSLALGSCASNKGRQGKLKEGKPIPCPHKDC